MKIGITAATGRLAKTIISALSREYPPHQIVGIARDPASANQSGIELRQGDYDTPKHWPQALSGIDTLLLISGMSEPELRAQQHRTVIEAARAAGVRKFVFTSVVGEENGCGFSEIVRSMRQTEQDVVQSGMQWIVGRNGLYIDPDIDYLDIYIKEGKIANSAGDGKCAYTTRAELAAAYCRLLREDHCNNRTYTLAGEPISQAQLAAYINQAFGTSLTYEPMAPAIYLKREIAELGEGLGRIIAGIYEGIHLGHFDVQSDFEAAAGRPHVAWSSFFQKLKQDA